MSLSQGRAYEQKAKDLLIGKNYRLLYENFYSYSGEIDLIAFKEKSLIFVEVKYRNSAKFGHVTEMVNYKKQQKLIKTAQFFLLKYPKYNQFNLRFDLIAFEGNDKYYWIEGAFGV